MSGAMPAKVAAEDAAAPIPAGDRRRQPRRENLKLRHARPDDRQAAGRLLREALTPGLADAVFGLGGRGRSHALPGAALFARRDAVEL